MRDKLDAELARAAGLGTERMTADRARAEADSPASVAPQVVAIDGADRAPSTRRRWGLLLVLLGLLAATVTMVLMGFDQASVYAMPVDELMRRADELEGRRVRIDGELVPGTLEHRPQPCAYHFRLRSADQQVAVHYPQCVVPDNLRDEPSGVLVTVEGVLTEQGTFEASDVMAQCSSRYDPETRTMRDGDG